MATALALAFTATGDQLAGVAIGPTSALGICTTLAVIVVVLVLPSAVIPSRNLAHHDSRLEEPINGARPPLAMLLFALWASAILVTKGVTVDGLQNVALFWLFFGVTALTSAGASVGTPRRASRWLMRIAVLLGVVYATALATDGPNASRWLGPRGFALEALVLLAASIAWLPVSRRRYAFLLPASLLLLIFLSLSRTASAAAVIIVVVALAVRTWRRWSLRRAVLLAVPVVLSVAALARWVLIHYEPLRDRFVTGDVASVGGLDVNVSGRSTLWQLLWASARDEFWFGHGAGSAGLLARSRLQFVDEPHNDYLRLLHDYGAIGLMLFMIALVGLGVASLRAARRASLPSEAAPHWAAVLALLALTLAMTTDNAIIYAFVMLPLAVIVGSSLAVGRTTTGGAPDPRPMDRTVLRL
jgi:O-antigen ligase